MSGNQPVNQEERPGCSRGIKQKPSPKQQMSVLDIEKWYSQGGQIVSGTESVVFSPKAMVAVLSRKATA